MKRILHLIKGLGRGGAEQLLVNAAPHRDASRFRYEVAYLLPYKDAVATTLGDSGVGVHCLDGERGLGWLKRLQGLVLDRSIDLVHVHSPYVGVGARLALWGKGQPRLVSTEHNVWQSYHTATHWGTVLTFARNDHVFAVSDEVRASIRYPRLMRFLPMPPVETVYYGLDPTHPPRATQPPDAVRRELGIPPGAPVVGMVANFRPKKGHQFLLKAALQVRSEIPEVRFVLVGRGPMERSVRDLAHELELTDTVIFAGYREDVATVVQSFDLFALASVHEGLPIALLEAMALGKPAVVTRAGGVAEVMEDGKQGLVVPVKDPTALARAIVRLLNDPQLRDRMAIAARERAGEFDVRDAVRRTEAVYEQLLQ